MDLGGDEGAVRRRGGRRWLRALHVGATPALCAHPAGAVALAVELAALRRGADHDLVAAGGLAARVVAVVAWLLASERSPVSTLAAAPSLVTEAPPEVVASVARMLAWRGGPALLAAALAVGLLGRALARSADEGRALTRRALGVGAIASLGPSLLAAGYELAVPTPKPLWERVPLAAIAPVAPDHAPARRYRQVFLVMMESTSAEAMRREAAPGTALARLRDRAARFEETLSTGNASHLAQPSILTSHDHTGSRLGEFLVRRAPQPTLGVADWFSLAGYRTVMVSSQDERWLGMERVAASQRWDTLVHAVNFGDPSALYRDACGVTKVLDSHTVARFTREVDAAPGPVFGYLNLQNTHFAYVAEGDGRPRDFEGLTCDDFVSMPAGRVARVRERYLRAQDEAVARLDALVARYPEALFAVVGDHGEELVAGPRFGHAKSLALAQVATFLWFIGPGVAPGARRVRASVLDALPTLLDVVAPGASSALPRGLLAGHSLWGSQGSAHRTFFAVGLEGARTAVRADRQLRADRDGERCVGLGPDGDERPLPAGRCADLDDSLAQWRQCQRVFTYRPPGALARAFNPCHALFEGSFDRPD